MGGNLDFAAGRLVAGASVLSDEDGNLDRLDLFFCPGQLGEQTSENADDLLEKRQQIGYNRSSLAAHLFLDQGIQRLHCKKYHRNLIAHGAVQLS
jgi:hypothetical protein